MKSIYNEALASQKVFCKYYIRLVMDAFISFSKYFIQSILDTESSWLLPLSHEKAQILNPNELTTNSFPSEVEIKERERGKEEGEAVLSQIHKPKYTSRSARPAINPSLDEGSSQLAWQALGLCTVFLHNWL